MLFLFSSPDDIQFRLKCVDVYNLFDDTDDGVDDIFQRLFSITKLYIIMSMLGTSFAQLIVNYS